MKLTTLVLTAALAMAPAMLAAPVTYKVILNGSNEFPPVASPGTGTATVVIDVAAHTLDITMSFSGLLGTTTASHIHCCTTVAGTGNAGVATQVPRFIGFPTGVTAGSYSHVFDMTQSSSFNPSFVTANGGTAAGAEAALAAGAAAGKAYLNIHTVVAPGGEISGFLVPCTPLTFTSLTASSSVLWPPNHKMVPVTLSDNASSTCGVVSCKIISVSSNEPVDPDGDWVITGDLTLELRADRLGTRRGNTNGRVYTITVQCTDGLTTLTKTATVLVPHDQGN